MISDQTATVPGPLATQSAAPLLCLLAMDPDDLAVLSAHLQDMRVAVGDLAFLPAERRFAMVGKRFDWVKAGAGGCERCATGLHFDCVQAVARIGFAQGDDDRELNLLAIEYAGGGEAADTSEATLEGTITLTFSGGAALRLTVECLEVHMRDLGERWPCDRAPVHP